MAHQSMYFMYTVECNLNLHHWWLQLIHKYEAKLKMFTRTNTLAYSTEA